MVLANEIIQDIQQLTNAYGTAFRLRYFTGTGSSADYDELFWTASGNAVWMSGLIAPQGAMLGRDYKFMEQGRILTDDHVIYFPGSLAISVAPPTGTIMLGLGSPPTQEYVLTPPGAIPWSIEGSVVFYECHVRVNNTGSLYQQY